MFSETESAEELAQAAVDELTDLDRKLGTDSADADWESYLDSFHSKAVLEPSAAMVEEVGKRFEGVRFFSADKSSTMVVYINFNGKSKSIEVTSSYDYEIHTAELSNLNNVELRFEALTSGSISR